MNFLDFLFVSTVFVSVAVGSSLAVIKWGQWEIGRNTKWAHPHRLQTSQSNRKLG